MPMSEPLPIWVIYYNPKDRPGKYVARKWLASTTAEPTAESFVADTLDQVRALLPRGLCYMQRHIQDDPCIVETWI